jgi:hypothetical protein
MTRVSASQLAALLELDHPTWANETEFQRDVISLARDRGWGITVAAYKALAVEAAQYHVDAPPLDGLIFHPRYSLGSDPGWPDLFLARRRDQRVLFRELKTDKGPVSPRQVHVLELLTACGLDARIWRPADWPLIQEELR